MTNYYFKDSKGEWAGSPAEHLGWALPKNSQNDSEAKYWERGRPRPHLARSANNNPGLQFS